MVAANATPFIEQQQVANATDLAEKIGSKVWEATTAIAESLSVSAKHLYSVITLKYVAVGVSYLILFILSIAVVRLLLLHFKEYKTSEITVYDVRAPELNWLLKFIVLFGLSWYLLSTLLPNLSMMFVYLIAPEYGAINEITQMVKELMK